MKQRNKLPRWIVPACMAALLWLVCAGAAFANGKTGADVGKPTADATYTATPVDGLPPGSVWTIAFDGEDRPWVGTDGGVVLGDDGQWQPPAADGGLGGESVRAWLFAADGALWVGTDRSLDVFANGVKTAAYGWADGMAASGVEALALDHDGNIWAAHLAEGVSRFDGSQWRNYTTADGLADNWVYSIAVDGAGNVWFGTGAGVSVFDGENWNTYTTRDGLAGEWVSGVASAPNGKLWFATDGGVSEYDGETWTTHLAGRNVRAVAAAADGAVWAAGGGFVGKWDGDGWRQVQPAYFANQLPITLAVRANGEVWVGTLDDGAVILTPKAADSALNLPAGQTLWLGTPAAVTVLSGDEQWRFDTADGLADDDVRAILIDSQGRRWFGTAGGATVYDGLFWGSDYPSAQSISSNYVYKVAIDPQGRTWFAYGERGLGVSVKDGDEWRQYTADDGLTNEQVYSMAFGADGKTWVGTADGVFQLDGTRWVNLGAQFGAPRGKVETLAVAPGGELWVGFADGIAVFDGRVWVTLGTDTGLTIGAVHALVFDEDGNLWVGAAPSSPGKQDGGLFFYDGDYWTVFAMNRTNTAYSGPAAEPVGDWINDLALDSAGQLWVGALAYALAKPGWVVGGVSVYTGDVVGDVGNDVGWTNYTPDNGLVSDSVTALAVDAQGRIWAGTRKGLGMFDGQGWANFTTADGLPNLHVTDLAADAAGGVWITTWGGGAVYFDGAGWRYLTTQRLADREVNALAEDHDGAIWFATAGGVSRFDGEAWTVYTTRDGLADNDSRAVVVDGEGSVWVGGGGGKFEGDALSRFDGERWMTYTLSGDMVYANIAALAVDPEGTAWAVAWSPQQFTVLSGLFRFDGEQWRQQAAGPGPLADDRVYAFAIDGTGRLWFGTDGSYGSPTLLTFDGQTWDQVRVDEANSPVRALALAGGEGGYLGTDAGLAQFHSAEDGEVTVTGEPARRKIPIQAIAIEQAD